jgi:hypothetical protein
MGATALAQVPQSLGERLFVEGTALFRGTANERNAQLGLQKLISSANIGYELAPYGLCIALSAEPEVFNLVESYAWCRVAERRASRFADRAATRATEVLGRIAVHEGVDRVVLAKQRADELERQLTKNEP